MAKTVLSPEEQVVQFESAIGQAQRQIDVLEARNRELSGYQSEAIDSRVAIAKLQADVADATARADASAKEATVATAAARDSATASRAGGAKVAAAMELVAALKKLG